MSAASYRSCRLSWLALGMALTVLGAGCKGRRQRTPQARPDAAARGRAPDAGVRPRPARPGAVRRLLRFVPAREQWFVTVANLEGMTAGLGRLWTLLTRVPDLGPAMARLARPLRLAVGAWPPSPALWATLGFEPRGGIVVAQASRTAGRPGGVLVVAQAARPDRLLRRLVSAPPGGRPTSAAPRPAAWSAAAGWWCAGGPEVVVCGSEVALVRESLALGAGPPAGSLAARVPADLLRGAELLGGWRSGPKDARSVIAARFPTWGVELRARLRDERLDRWLGWLAPARAPASPPPVGVAAASLELDRDRLATLLGLLPGGSVPAARLFRQCTGEVRLVVGGDGWSAVASRDPTAAAIPTAQRWSGSGVTFWVLGPASRLAIASSADGARAALGRQLPDTLPAPLARLWGRKASARLRLPLVDPLELLPPAARLRLVASLAGMPDGERAFVALARALLTLAGEAVIVVDRAPAGAHVHAALLSPAGGAPGARKSFAALWQSKWQGGGFYDRAALRAVAATHPDAGVGRVSGALQRLREVRPLTGWLATWLVETLAWLRDPQLDCAELASRLRRCREAFGRQVSAWRWKELDSLALPGHRRRLRAELEDRAARDARALQGRCDRLGGRLENAAVARRCLEANTCPTFASCLVRAFRPR